MFYIQYNHFKKLNKLTLMLQYYKIKKKKLNTFNTRDWSSENIDQTRKIERSTLF